MTVATSDPERVSRIIDIAIVAGANNVERLEFAVTDKQALQAQALKKAVEDGRAQAEVVAKTLGVKVARIRGIHIQPFEFPTPPQRPAMLASGVPQTPVESRMVEVRAHATLDMNSASNHRGR